MSVYDEMTTEELQALQKGDYDSISKESLIKLANVSSQTQTPSPKTPIKGGGYLAELLGRFGNAATAGLVNPAAAGISSVIDEGLQAGGVIPERSIGEAYDYYKNAQKRRAGQFQEENPKTAIAADIAGMVAPGGAMSKTTQVGQKAATGLKLGGQGAGIFSKAAEGLVRGGVGNALYGQVAADADSSLSDRGLNAGIDFAVGGLPDAALSGGARTISKGSEYLSDKKIPQKIYSWATGLGKEGGKNTDMVDILLKEGAVGSKDTLQNLSAQRVKEIGGQLRSALSGKEANYDQIVSQIKNFEDSFASGERETAKNALSKVMGEFEGLFKSKSPGPSGVMQRPDFGDYKADFLKKNAPNKGPNVYAQNAEPASVEDMMDYYLGKLDQSGEVTPPSGKVTVTRSAGGYPVNKSPIYSETRNVGRDMPAGMDLPENFFPKEAPPVEVVPPRPNLISEAPVVPTEDDIYRMYLQQYPEESIALAASEGGPKTINLADLNFEKSRLANSAKRLYDNPDLGAQATKRAQKEIADVSRSVIEEQAPEVRALNQRYHAYDALNDALTRASEKEFAQPMIKAGLTDLGVGAVGGLPAVAAKRGLESTRAQTNVASFLYNLLNKGKKFNLDRLAPLSGQGAGVIDQAARMYDKNQGN